MTRMSSENQKLLLKSIDDATKIHLNTLAEKLRAAKLGASENVFQALLVAENREEWFKRYTKYRKRVKKGRV